MVLTCIDLFCGCGGFTLGMQRAGFHVLAAIDSDPVAVNTLRSNLVDQANSALKPVDHALQRDLTRFHPHELAGIIGSASVDVIVGGPPCQGFSTARQVDGSNHGPRLKRDSRRLLYRDFLRYVEYFEPRIFVIENVIGIRSAAGGRYFDRLLRDARCIGESGMPRYRIQAQIEDARELGIPQKRRRQFIIGVRNDQSGYFPMRFVRADAVTEKVRLWDAIGDLPVLSAGTGENISEYEIGRRVQHTLTNPAAIQYLSRVAEVELSTSLANHVARPHSSRDLRDFAKLREGENSQTATRDRGVVFEFPYRKDHFKDRYTRQARCQPCSTIVAHMSKDGLMFIHPTQDRSLTPREAARVQSFPDWYVFPSARTHAFRLIGNAVPPLVAQAVGTTVSGFLAQAKETRATFGRSSVTASAEQLLSSVARLDKVLFRRMPARDFLAAWHAALLLFPDLHPLSARDHGKRVRVVRDDGRPDWLKRRFVRSGWPVALSSLVEEALRRHDSGAISEGAFYCISVRGKGFQLLARYG